MLKDNPIFSKFEKKKFEKKVSFCPKILPKVGQRPKNGRLSA